MKKKLLSILICLTMVIGTAGIAYADDTADVLADEKVEMESTSSEDIVDIEAEPAKKDTESVDETEITETVVPMLADGENNDQLGDGEDAGDAVESKEISDAALSNTSYAYTGEAIEPEVVVYDADGEVVSPEKYNVSYAENVDVGTAIVTIEGKDDYTGTLTKTFKIAAVNISSAKLAYQSKTYNGTAFKPRAAVKATVNGSEKKLEANKDYSISYKNNKNAGTATVTIKGKGNFKGTLTQTFTIKPLSLSSSYFKANGGADAHAAQYTGKKVKPGADAYLIVNGEWIELEEGKDYTITYKNNVTPCYVKGETAYLYADRPQPTAVIKGKGNYKGTIKRTFNIYPPHVICYPLGKRWNRNSVTVGKKVQMEIMGQYQSFIPEGYKQGTWTSQNPKIVSVSKTGKITAKKTGKAVITFTKNGITVYKIIYVKKK